jgi:membrane protein
MCPIRHMSLPRPIDEPPKSWLDPNAPQKSPKSPNNPLELAKNTWNSFNNDDCMTLGAAMAYYTVFSLAPLLLTIISIAGLVFGRDAVQNQIAGQISGLIGPGAAEQVQSMLAHQWQNQSGGIIGTVIGIITLIFGATGAFAALQDALNKAWHVQPDPATGGIKTFLTKRLMSFGMILGVVFLLIASLAVSAALAAATTWMGGYLPQSFSGTVARGLTFLVSLGVIAALFALILKVLPDGRVTWRDAWVGGVLTSVLFTIGKTALGVYLGKAAPGSAYGAAGSLVVIVLWLYYASLILLFGAEFTKVWASAHKREIQPEAGAVKVVTETRKQQSGGEPQHAH